MGFEDFMRKNRQQKRPDNEISVGRDLKHLSSPRRQERAVRPEITTERIITEYLRKPKGGSFYCNLKQLMIAAVSVGVFSGTLAASAEEAIAPTISEEAYYMNKMTGRVPENSNGDDVQKKIAHLVEILTERGGIRECNELDTVSHPRAYRNVVFSLARSGENPSILKPENILGKKFIENEPELAEKYYEKISTAIRATVRIDTGVSLGSGALVETRNGVMVITNAHVVDKGDRILLSFYTKEFEGNAHVVASDKANDLAILEIQNINGVNNKEYKGDADFKKIFSQFNICPMKINPDMLKKGDHLAGIGNPDGYPFAVALSEYEFSRFHYEQDKVSGEVRFSPPDKRFNNLSKFGSNPFLKDYEKGLMLDVNQGYWGFSGGPVIDLDSDKAEVRGVNVVISHTDENDKGEFAREKVKMGHVPSWVICEFLKKTGF